jgi:large subunit ribosomal protein L19
MNTELLNKVEQTYMKKSMPDVNVGDTIQVVFSIGGEKKGDKKRNQTFRGLVIAIKGSGIRKSVTIRKISYGVGVEKIFPLHSPNVVSIKLLKKGKVRQANIYYMRERIGKKAMKVKEGEFDFADIVEGEAEEVTEETVATESEVKETVEEKKAE